MFILMTYIMLVNMIMALVMVFVICMTLVMVFVICMTWTIQVIIAKIIQVTMVFMVAMMLEMMMVRMMMVVFFEFGKILAFIISIIKTKISICTTLIWYTTPQRGEQIHIFYAISNLMKIYQNIERYVKINFMFTKKKIIWFLA